MMLREMIDAWMACCPVSGEKLEVESKALAKLLGHLVFASQVVPGGRTYMQGMLSAFGGFEVDWHRGRVKVKNGIWGLVPLSREWWLDIEWWSDHLETRNYVSFESSNR